MKQAPKGLNRKVINDPRLQFGVTGFFVGLGAINLLFFGILLKVLHSKVQYELNQINEDHRKFLIGLFNELSTIVFHSTLLFGTFILFFSFVGGILLLQHISGPSHAFKKFLSDILQGQKPRYPMKLRKYDFFSEQADLLNAVYEKFELNKSDKK